MQTWRVRNFILAAMFVGWAVARIIGAAPEFRFTLPTLGPAILELIVGFLFARRSAAEHEGDFWDLTVTTASLLVGAWMISLAPPATQWSSLSVLVFAIGTLIASISLLWLGKSFAIFPAYRKLITSGPYQLIRHPAYFGELIMLVGISIATLTTTSWLLLGTCLILFVIRIEREERLVEQACDCTEFRSNVRWRLIPFVW